jgi:membrane dipeptidase
LSAERGNSDAPSAERLHGESIVVDAHNDLVLSVTAKGLGERSTLRDRWLPELRAGGVDVQVCALYTDPEIPEAQLRTTLNQLAALRREVRLNAGDVRICLTGAEIDESVAEGRLAFVLALEGASALGPDEGLVELFFELGIRIISFTHFGRTPFADGSAEDAGESRLTSAGVGLFAELERLGVLCDVSHLGVRGVDHVLELATRPVIASHSSARSLRDHHRNLSDDQLRGIAATGGVIGINLLACFIDAGRPTIDNVIDHYEHIVETVGVEHVGIGPDFIADLYEDLFPPHADLGTPELDTSINVPGLYASRHLPNLTAGFLRRGFSEADIRLILGKNFLRVFRETLGVPA